ncbi:MAG: DsbA family protein [Alphaproteobacteria bacterium]|nr:DsbA family protein [Alphaproteobacteria bacterium]
MIYLKSLFLAGCAVIFGATSFAHAEPSAQAQKLPFREDQRAAMEDFVRNFILDNPEILMESVNRFRDKEVKKKEEQSISVLKENMNFLSNPQHPRIGNPNGDITVVEFFDYNCGYCKHALKSVQELTQKDKNVKVVFMEFPILSATSTLASKWALAANMQGKYWAFHQAVLESNAPKDDDNLIKIAKSVGMDIEKAKKDVAGKEIESYMASVRGFGEKLSVTGTPAFIVGQQIVRGYIEYPAFQTIVDGERNKSK